MIQLLVYYFFRSSLLDKINKFFIYDGKFLLWQKYNIFIDLKNCGKKIFKMKNKIYLDKAKLA